MYHIAAMIIVRNRLVALLSRIAMFIGLVVVFSLYFIEMSPAWRGLCFFEIQAGLLYIVFLGFEVIFNMIDMRHGIKGIAAGWSAPLMIMLTGYCFIGSALYFGYIIPIHEYLTLRSILYNAFLIAVPLLNWLLFEIKGNVRSYYAYIALAYPLIYVIFSMFRAMIWPNNPLYTPDTMYIYHFFDPSHKSFPWAIWVAAAITIAFFLLLILINNLLARKWKRKVPSLF